MTVRTTEQLIEDINAQFATFGGALQANSAELAKNSSSLTGLSGRMMGIEQAVAALQNNGGGGRAMLSGGRAQSWGAQFTEHERFKAWLENGKAGKISVPIKAELTTLSGVEQRDLIAPQRDTIQGLPQQVLTIRNLLPAIPTTSNLIAFVRQVSRDNQAVGVADAAEKPESSMGFELAESPVRTIATWIPCPRQTLDDLPGLAALINSELTFNLQVEEESQCLFGDGTGQNLLGIVPQALPFDPPIDVEDENPLDRILAAIVQAQQSRLRSDGVVINDITWAQLISLKDGQKRYLSGNGGGPFGSIGNSLWQVRVLPTPSMPRGECLVGAFGMGARLHDRLTPEILASSEDRDNFIKNMVTIRAEERVALTVRVPSSFVFIDQLGPPTSG